MLTSVAVVTDGFFSVLTHQNKTTLTLTQLEERTTVTRLREGGDVSALKVNERRLYSLMMQGSLLKEHFDIFRNVCCSTRRETGS